MKLDARVPAGPIAAKWDRHKFEMKLVNPANKRKYTIIVVGTGLAGASAAASLGELGYNVLNFCIQDSPRRGCIAAQGSINARTTTRTTATLSPVLRTVEATTVAQKPTSIGWLGQRRIDQCVAQGQPFAQVRRPSRQPTMARPRTAR
jgi:succinate dehydrogenase / fumarate reductase flavoprotein subunit